MSSRAFPSAPDRRQDLKHHVEKQVELGNLVRSASPYAAAGDTIREAGKEHGRLVIDYRRLNRRTIRHHNPIPDIFATLRDMADSRRLTALDLDTGFHHLGLTARASERLAVVVPEGQYRWLTLPMGPTNGPPSFQQAVSRVLAAVSRKRGSAAIFIDDLAIRT